MRHRTVRTRTRRVAVERLDARLLLSTVVVNTTSDTTVAGAVSLRSAINTANAATSATTITFDSKVFTSAKTITLTGGTLDLTNTKVAVTITGPAKGVTLDFAGGNASLLVEKGVTATMSSLSIVNSSNAAVFAYGTLTLKNDTLAQNAFGALADYGKATLINCTVADNFSPSYGGAIYNTGSLTLRDDTIVDNTGIDYGGGLFSYYGGTTSIGNTIIANNGFPDSGQGPDVYGTITSAGHNLIGASDGSSGWVSSDQTGTESNPINPLLSPLGNFGGPTPTMPPASGSPVINAGLNSLIPSGITTDQRGLPRIFNTTVDIGADESQTTAGSLVGTVFIDSNGNGSKDSGEAGLQYARLFLDLNNNGVRDANDPTVLTNSSGGYNFSNLSAGTYHLRIVQPPAYVATNKPSTTTFTITAGKKNTGSNFGEKPVINSTGSFVAVASNAPGGAVGTMFLLPDGTVMGEVGEQSWVKLSPDLQGHYSEGTWKTSPSSIDSRLYGSSQILPDGRLFLAGAEYGTGDSTGETYNQLTNTWTALPSQPFGKFADSASMLLNNGKILIAPVYPTKSGQTVLFNPATNTWAAGPLLFRGTDAAEQSWVKLPDGSIITADSDSTSERYIPATNKWIDDGAIPVRLFGSTSEMGPAVLLNDGRALFIGGDGHTALYTPSGSTTPGKWTAGPDLPDGMDFPDGPGAVLPDGDVLIESGSESSPRTFLLFHPATNAFSFVADGPADAVPYVGRMLDLPDGTVLISGASTTWIYNPNTKPLAKAVPIITAIAKQSDGSYALTGTGLNGITAGAAYGDDAQMDTNYPIIRVTDLVTHHVYYARSYKWSTTAEVTTGKTETVHFALPAAIGKDAVSLASIANGVASAEAIAKVANVSVTLGTSSSYTFATSVFQAKFTDSLSKSLSSITITTLPAQGSLKLGGVAVKANQTIAASSLSKLVYTPASGFHGTVTFHWTATDGTLTAYPTALVSMVV